MIGLSQKIDHPSMSALTEAFQAINNKEDFSQLTNTILEKALGLSDSRSATLLLVNKTTGELEIAAVRHVPERVITGYLQQPVRAVQVSDVYQDVEDAFAVTCSLAGLGELAAAEFDHYYVLPIRIHRKIIGYLTLACDQPFLVNPTSRERFSLYLEFMAQTIESAYFIYQLQQQNAHLELMMTKLQNTKNHLKRTEKMALVGQLAASVAHEIRNPLTIIGTSLQLVFEKMGTDHHDHELFETMLTKVRTVDQTIKELMSFARPVRLMLKSFPIERAIDRVVTFVSRKFAAKGMRIQKDLGANLPNVFLDEEQTERLLLNLLLNAYAVLPERGSVTISVTHDARQPRLSLRLADDGPGIPPEQVNQIFDPFFTTRQEGSGLGLFLVKNLIEEMNGSIEAANQEPHGAVFVLKCPIAL